MKERRLAPKLLPSFLQRTPEQVAQDEQAQAQGRASFTRSKMSEGERLVSRGAVLEEIARANIEAMEALRDEGQNDSTEGGANLEMVDAEYSKLAYGLELQGRFEEAAKFQPLKKEQARLKKLHQAVERDDALCGCPRKKERDPLSGQEVEISPRRPLKAVYSRKHGRAVWLYECLKCGTWNATPESGQGALIAANAEASIRGKRAVGSDAQLLGVNS